MKLWQLEECNLFTQQRIFTYAVVQEVSEWEIPPSRVVKYNGNNMVAYFCHHFQCEDEPGITKVMREV